MKLVDQWRTIEAGLPVGLGGRPALADDRAARRSARGRRRCSARSTPARSARRVVFHVQQRRGARTAPRRRCALFERLDRRPHLVPPRAVRRPRPPSRAGGARGRPQRAAAAGVAESWDAALAAAALRLDGSPLRARDRVERAARSHSAPVRAAEPGPRRLAPRLHVPLLRPVRLRRLAVDGAPLLRAPRPRGDRRHDPRPPRPLRHGQRRHPGAGLARGRQDAVAAILSGERCTQNRDAAALEHGLARVAAVDERSCDELTFQVTVPTNFDVVDRLAPAPCEPDAARSRTIAHRDHGRPGREAP